MTSEFCRVHFSVKCTTEIGQVVAIGGNTLSLGYFQQANVVQLVSSPEDYPIWRTASPIIVPKNNLLQYKYCIQENGICRAFEKVASPRTMMPTEFDIKMKLDSFDAANLEGNWVDSETELLANLERMIVKEDERSSVTSSGGGRGRLFLTCYHLPVVIQRRKDCSILCGDSSDISEALEVNWAESIMAKTEDSVAGSLETFWVGNVNLPSNPPLNDTEMTWLKEKLITMNCIPIFLEKNLIENAYYGYCKQVLWPLFHNVDQIDHIHAVWKQQKHPTTRAALNKQRAASRDRARSRTNSAAAGEIATNSPTKANNATTQPPDLSISSAVSGEGIAQTASAAATGRNDPNGQTFNWKNNGCDDEVFPIDNTDGLVPSHTYLHSLFPAYQEVNHIFEKVLLALVKPDDVVWVHDYHLMLLPAYLRRGAMAAATSNPVSYADLTTPESTTINFKLIFFLHVPFPTSQLFRCLPQASQLLVSITCADVVGFHAFDYTRHFIHAAKRILGMSVKARPGGLVALMVGDREVIVTMNHVAIEPVLIDQALANPATHLMAEQIRSKYSDRRIVVGVDVCQRLSGVALKLESFDKYLSDDPRGAKRVVLIQKCLRTGTRKEDEQSTSNELKYLVNAINQKYSKRFLATDAPNLMVNNVGGGYTVVGEGSIMSGSPTTFNRSHRASPSTQLSPPAPKSLPHVLSGLSSNGSGSGSGAITNNSNTIIDYEEVSSLSIISRVALWLAADVYLSTAMREGLNNGPMEYICCRRSLPNAGALILSEFSLSSTLLSGSFKTNPYNVAQVSEHIEMALNMSQRDSDTRRQRDIGFVSTHPSSLWTKRIVLDLRHASTDEVGQPSLLTVKNVFDCYRQNPVPSSSTSTTESCASSGFGSRIFILDYGGTLVDKEGYDVYIKHSHASLYGRLPSESIMTSLKKLSDDPTNIVMIVTGLSRPKVQEIFEHLPNLSIASSQGLFYSWGESLLSRMREVGLAVPLSKTDPHTARQWFSSDFDLNWGAVKGVVEPIFRKFTYSCNGSSYGLELPVIKWNFFGSDPEQGKKQAAQLGVELEASLARHDVKVIISEMLGSVEVVPYRLNKGLIPKLLLETLFHMRKGQLPLFVFCAGDSVADDHMFQSIYSFIGGLKEEELKGVSPFHAFTVSIGRAGCNRAMYHVHDHNDVEGILETLSSL